MAERVDARAVLLHGEDVATRQKPGTFWRLEDEIEVAEALDSAVAALRQTLADLKAVGDVGHSNDCLFCGFKDKIVRDVLAGKCAYCGVGPGETHGITCPHLPKGVFGSLTPEISTGFKEPE